MKLGALTAAPEAFVDFCRRQPVECGLAPLDSNESGAAANAAVFAKVERQQLEAQRLAWQAAFSRSAPAPVLSRAVATTTGRGGQNWAALFAAADATATPHAAELPAVEPASEVRMAASDWDTPTAATGAPGSVDWAKIFARTRTVASSPAVDTEIETEAPAIDLTSAQAMDTALWSKLNRINSKINRAITRKVDDAALAGGDLWNLPLENGQKYGDCEDYVLEKRLALVAAGVPQSALSIAVVETSWGEGHAVLVVTTDRGEYVLDNLSPWVLPWTETTYRWKARQTTRSAFSWALVASL